MENIINFLENIFYCSSYIADYQELGAKLYKRLWCFKIEMSTYRNKNIN